MIHESAAWSSTNNQWYFLPRKCSHDKYNETLDEIMGCHYIITADANFKNIHSMEVSTFFMIDRLGGWPKLTLLCAAVAKLVNTQPGIGRDKYALIACIDAYQGGFRPVHSFSQRTVQPLWNADTGSIRPISKKIEHVQHIPKMHVNCTVHCAGVDPSVVDPC